VVPPAFIAIHRAAISEYALTGESRPSYDDAIRHRPCERNGEGDFPVWLAALHRAAAPWTVEQVLVFTQLVGVIIPI